MRKINAKPSGIFYVAACPACGINAHLIAESGGTFRASLHCKHYVGAEWLPNSLVAIVVASFSNNETTTEFFVGLAGRRLGFVDNYCSRMIDVLLARGAKSVTRDYNVAQQGVTFKTDLELTWTEVGTVAAEADRLFDAQFDS